MASPTIDITALEIYFPHVNKPRKIGDYTFTISLQQSQDTFVINLHIRQQDTKEGHLIKFRLGMGRDKPQDSVHQTAEPHFEVDVYKRGEEAFQATLYFTFTNGKLADYAKGTVVLINKILKQFLQKHQLSININELIFDEAVEELSAFEAPLIEALYDCYKRHTIIVRRKGQEPVVIRTPHRLQQYLDVADLAPLYLPLAEKISRKRFYSSGSFRFLCGG